MRVTCPDCQRSFEVAVCRSNTPRNESSRVANETSSILPAALMVGGAMVAAPCLALSLFGFGAAGIVGGSMAAATQATIGNVAAGSTFALLQSAGATGMFVNGMAAGTAAVGVGAAAQRAKSKPTGGGRRSDTNDRNENEQNEEEDDKRAEMRTEEEDGAALRFCPYCGGRIRVVNSSNPQ